MVSAMNMLFLPRRRLTAIVYLGILVMAALVGASAGGEQGATRGQIVVHSLEVDATVVNGYAVTEVTQHFENTGGYPEDVMFQFGIPDRAFLSNLTITVNNVPHYGKVVERAAALETYEAAVSQGQTAGMVSEGVAKNLFSTSLSLASRDRVNVTLRFEEFIPRIRGGYEYAVPLSSCTYPLGTGDFKIRVDVRTPTEVQSFQTPSHPASDINRAGGLSRIAYYHPEIPNVSTDYVVRWTQSPLPEEGSILAHDEDGVGYFCHVFAPDLYDLGGVPMSKDIIFVLDRSGSMSGDPMNQVKDSFASIVEDLRSQDRFNVIFFDDDITLYRHEILDANESARKQARNYIDSIEAAGSTNINDALLTALEMYSDTNNSVPIIVFLTDGQPTAGVTWPDTIRSNVRAANENCAAIFSLGYGSGCDLSFLEALSLENYATATHIQAGTDAKVALQGFYETISTPLLKNITFNYDAGADQVYPSQADQLFEGSEIAVVGRYDSSNSHMTSTVKAQTTNGKKVFEKSFALGSDLNNNFIPRLWAYRHINGLLDRIKVEGEDQELVGEVVDLSVRWNFVTPYTSMIMVMEEPEDVPDAEPTDQDTEPADREGDVGYDMGVTGSNDTGTGGDENVMNGWAGDGEGEGEAEGEYGDDDCDDSSWEQSMVYRDNGDSDGDGLPDWWEQEHGMDPYDPTDATEDKIAVYDKEENSGGSGTSKTTGTLFILLIAIPLVLVVLVTLSITSLRKKNNKHPGPINGHGHLSSDNEGMNHDSRGSKGSAPVVKDDDPEDIRIP